jgi:hypothetical protein
MKHGLNDLHQQDRIAMRDFVEACRKRGFTVPNVMTRALNSYNRFLN